MKRLLVAFLFSQLFLAPAAWAQNKVRLNWGAITGVMGPIWVAQQENLFKKHGLELELIHIASTSRAIQSMLMRSAQCPASAGAGLALYTCPAPSNTRCSD